MQKIWAVKKPDVSLIAGISKGLNIPTLLSCLLINRGISDIEEAAKFLACSLDDLHSPFLLKGLDISVARIKQAALIKQKVAIWGDYDADGLTATALLRDVLVKAGLEVTCYIPHRIDDGYGLNIQGLEKIKKLGIGLLITVDCGISSFKEIEFLNESGIDTIVVDHHRPLSPGPLPKAFSIINPLQEGCGYPFKHLAGVGLAFKLSQAITGLSLFEHLDLVALGTVSDIVPMRGENRILTRHGLKVLSRSNKIGLIKLLENAGIENKRLSTMHAGFILGPRLNATGRMSSALNSFRLLTSESEIEAELLAGRLSEDNRLRRQLESQTLKEALAKIDIEVNFKDHRIIVLYKQDWHPGVMGIVASRLVERFYRPTILLTCGRQQTAVGSGRSVDHFHLFDALSGCSGLLERFGGHSKACGMSIKKERIEDFKDAINDYARHALPQVFSPVLNIDAHIPLSLLKEDLIKRMEDLSPFGCENPKPVFITQAVAVKTRPRIVGKNTLKVWVSDSDITCEAVGFKMGEELHPDSLGKIIDIVYTPALNDWQGDLRIELHLKDIRDTGITQPW